MLNEKQERFCKEYIIDLNATQAAIRAGYSEKTAYSIGQRLLKNVEIQKRITELQMKPLKKLEITAESVLQKFIEIRDRCLDPESYDASNALRANEALGKHLKLFTDKIEIEVTKMPEIKITK